MARALPQLPGYEIQSRIGEGAGAVITLAMERASRRQVAIKHVVCADEEAEKFVVQAENEYEVAHQLDHPGLRKYFDIVRIKKWFKTREVFLVMEYIDGVKLEDKVPERLESLTQVLDGLRIFTEVADALHAMHTAGFVHADIKPNNIMVTGDGGVKVIDFGQSCALGHQKERVQGTPDYMAPEQINRHPLDQRTDIFNLGATMYRTFTGKYYETQISMAEPGTAKHELEALRGNQPPHELNPNLPISLSKLISECCNDRPGDRPPTMKSVISRLQTAQHTVERRREHPEENFVEDTQPRSVAPPTKPKTDAANADDDEFWQDLGLELDSRGGARETP